MRFKYLAEPSSVVGVALTFALGCAGNRVGSTRAESDAACGEDCDGGSHEAESGGGAGSGGRSSAGSGGRSSAGSGGRSSAGSGGRSSAGDDAGRGGLDARDSKADVACEFYDRYRCAAGEVDEATHACEDNFEWVHIHTCKEGCRVDLANVNLWYVFDPTEVCEESRVDAGP